MVSIVGVVAALTWVAGPPVRSISASSLMRWSPIRATATSPKAELLAAIAEFDAATASDGLPSVDFGVKGGELDSETRAPRDLYQAGAYHAVSKRVGDAADAVLAKVECASAANPTPRPTETATLTTSTPMSIVDANANINVDINSRQHQCRRPCRRRC